MNNRGQIGVIIGVFITVLVGLIILQAAASYTHTYTTTITNHNETIQIPTGNTYLDLTGQELLSTPVVTNGSGAEVITADGNYTIDEGVSTTTGVKTIRYYTNPNSRQYNASTDAGINVTYDYGPDGYIDNSGGRSLAAMIIVFFALAIAVIVLVPVLKNKFT